ncbi:MAG: mandelate racemase/muconate lactonizing enzyme family protein [Thermomicrobiales bacterium]|nr:mandelate racemase/muconate lactonizing enzyme family protein [Thermomicrobiales bacterium]
MKITDIRFTVIGESPVVRVLTDEGIDGFGAAERAKPYLRTHVLELLPALLGEDPTNVERCMTRIRHRGGFKPWGSAVSAVEIALWDIAGKAAGIPVYKLLGGKVRDRVRVYNGAVRKEMTSFTPEDYARDTRAQMASPEGFTIIKQGIAFHSQMKSSVPDFTLADQRTSPLPGYLTRGPLTEKGMKLLVECVAAMKDVLGDDVGLALDCGPGWTVPDAIRFARSVEEYNILWLEDLVAGDYTPSPAAHLFREITRATSTPIHTGEQIYLRQNFRELIETRAVSVVGPDPCDVGGIAELKWIAEYADLHGILMAPHGTGNGIVGLAALVHVCATLPDNYVAFEYTTGRPEWWYDIVSGLPDPIVRDGFIDVWDGPGLGIAFDVERSRQYLPEQDRYFFD